MKEKYEVIEKIRVTFPDFVITKEMEDLPTVIIDFFTDYLISAISKKEIKIISDIGRFINEIALSKDKITSICLDEFLLNLYDIEEQNLKKFMDNLSDHTILRYNKVSEVWSGKKR